MKKRRISFSEYDAANIYEWWLAFNQGMEINNDPILCCCCPIIAGKLKKFLGKTAKEREKAVKEHPYFKSPHSTHNEVKVGETRE